ncbi:lys-63-specific deubiquitinase BRCC36 isoform 3-T3 [Morphnus guianensis]
MGGSRGTQREEVLPGRGSWPAPARAVGSYPPSGTRSRRQGALHGAVWWRFPGRAVPLGLGPPLSWLAPTRSSSCCESQSLESGKLPICTPDCTLMRTFSLLKVDTSRIVHIHSVIILRRSDKRKDRVEISPEQLSAASTEAERLAEMTGRPMRVVGWYHSHPHITVWPSHVDVRTQAMYQMMDQGFVGLIFSCFIEDKNTKSASPASRAGLVVGFWDCIRWLQHVCALKCVSALQLFSPADSLLHVCASGLFRRCCCSVR